MIRGKQIEDAGITTAKIANLAIVTALIAANAVTSAKVDGTVLSTAAPGAGASFDAGSRKLVNVLDPTAAQDAATKAYVDATKQGLDTKDSVRVATAAALPAYTRSGNVITMTSAAVLTVDGVATVLNDRILVKDGAAGADNGIYSVTTEGTAGVAAVLTRAIDADVSSEVTGGMYTFVNEGTTNADSGWVLTTNDLIMLNTTALTFTQFSGAGQITAGAGLTKTGNTLDVGAGNGIQVNADTVEVLYGAVGVITSVDAGDAAAAGTNNTAARSDHQHAVTTAAPTVTVKSEATAAGTGTATSLMRTDAQIQAATASPTVTVKSDAATAGQGTASTLLRSDAALLAATAAPANVGTGNAQGSSQSLARADHVHDSPALNLVDHRRASAATTGANQTTGLTITNTPAIGSMVNAYLNGVELEVGDAVKTKDFYFSADGGTTARQITAIVAADTLYWTKANGREVYDLATTDVITLEYLHF